MESVRCAILLLLNITETMVASGWTLTILDITKARIVSHVTIILLTNSVMGDQHPVVVTPVTVTIQQIRKKTELAHI